jgi:hypothetical protein
MLARTHKGKPALLPSCFCGRTLFENYQLSDSYPPIEFRSGDRTCAAPDSWDSDRMKKLFGKGQPKKLSGLFIINSNRKENFENFEHKDNGETG